jgi:hypothetical protein
MGWYGDRQDDLNDAIRTLKAYPKNTLGWYKGILQWEEAIYKLDYNMEEFKSDLVNLLTSINEVPDLTYQENEYERYFIACPDFDDMQVLTVKNE